jgi:cell volume regulation protein A
MSLEFSGFSLEWILLFGSGLLVLSVLASRISSSLGLPALLIFLGIGMLAGSEGPGQIPFDNYSLAFAIGSVCLAFILFDGGLRTSWRSVRPVLPLATSLSFVGTVVTGVATGVFAHFILKLGWLEGLLLGAIVSSTDAAAVFSILRSRGLGLKNSLKQTLEFEAGSNDPVAVFLTVSVLALLLSPDSSALDILILFVQQAGIGLLFGYLGATSVRWIINKAGLEFEGLYGVLMIGLVIVLFAITSQLGGSGFLAVYVAGIVLGKIDFLHKGSVTRFFDGIAWISQILIFLVLGLLVFPSKVILVWREGLILALFMMFVARPLSVFIAAPGKSLGRADRLFVSWIGLRGAAPIILATLPWSLGIPNADYYFNLVFFIVLISVVFQGISIPWVASRLKVTIPIQDEVETFPEMGKLLPSGFIAFEAVISKEATGIGTRIVDLGLPPGVLLTSLERDGRFLVPQGNTTFQAGDLIRGFARNSNLADLNLMFGQAKEI